MRILFFTTVAALLFSCNSNKGNGDSPASKNRFTDADKIVYSYHAGAYPGALKYKITVTPEEINFTMEAASHAEKVEKTYPFTQTNWYKLIASFDDLRIKGKANNDCDGSSEGLLFYNEGEKIGAANDYHCGNGSRNVNGADLSLTYLIKDFEKLKASLLEKSDPDDETDADDEYKWTSAERKQYLNALN